MERGGQSDDQETLGITYAFGDEAPPGVVEQLVAARSGVGDYTGYWKRGAILETSLNKTLVLVELRDRLVEPTVLVKDKRIKVPDADPIREVELAIELRGPKSMRSELWGLALMLKSRADTLLAEWPEIETEAEMRCPSCLSSGTEPCPSWPADAEKRAERMCPIVPTCPECGSLVDLVGVAADEERYRAPSLRMPPDIERSLQSNPPPFKLGHPIQASWSLSRVLGVDKKFLEQVLALDTADRLAAIAGEIRELGCDEADAHGWTDGDWLSYLMESEASEAPLPPGMPSDVLDYGHRGMNLEAFTNHPMAVAAGLDKAHVLALRLATSTAFVRLTAPLFVGCQPSPHPYPTTVALLNEAICALQAAQQQQAAEDDDPGPTLWRGVSNLEVSTELLQRGGTIIAPTAFSTSSSVAKESAAGSHHMDFPFPPAILKVRMEGGMTACDVRFLSCFPREAMYLLPPGTYLHCAGNDPKPKEEWDGLELGLRGAAARGAVRARVCAGRAQRDPAQGRVGAADRSDDAAAAERRRVGHAARRWWWYYAAPIGLGDDAARQCHAARRRQLGYAVAASGWREEGGGGCWLVVVAKWPLQRSRNRVSIEYMGPIGNKLHLLWRDAIASARGAKE